MKYSALFFLSFALCVPATAEVPIDLAQVVLNQCGPEGYRLDGGCAIELGDGTYTVSAPVRLGRCEAGSVGTRNSVAIVGMGAGGMTQVPRFATAGTTLRWTGPAGGTMIEVCGSLFTLQHLTIDAAGAGVAVRLMANNAGSAISHFPRLAHLAIDGADIGIEVSGAVADDQTDFVDLERVSIRNVGVCYSQDSGQTVLVHHRLVECVASRKGWEIRGGSLVCDVCYVGSRGTDPAFIGFHLTKSAIQDGRNLAHHQVAIRGAHMEVRAGRFVVGDAGTRYPLLIVDSSYSLQCDPGAATTCEMTVIDWREQSPVIIQGNVYQGSNPSGKKPTPRMCSTPGWRSTGNVVKAEVAPIVWACQ